MSFPLRDLTTKQAFKMKVVFNGAYLKFTVPETFDGRRFESVYADGKLIICLARGDAGVKAANSYGRIYVQMGKKHVKGMPICKFTTDAVIQDGQIIIDVPMAPSPVKVVAPQTDEPASKSPRESALKCIKFLNSFAPKNGFTFDVTNGQLSLVKEDRIA